MQATAEYHVLTSYHGVLGKRQGARGEIRGEISNVLRPLIAAIQQFTCLFPASLVPAYVLTAMSRCS
jgi:hypothetical protein